MKIKRLMLLSIVLLGSVSYYTVKSSMPTKGMYDSIAISDIEQTVSDIQYKSIESDSSGGNILYQKNITQIIIHHTATDPNQESKKLFTSITRNHTNRWIKGAIVKTGQQMMYHRLIGSDGTIYGDKDFNEIGWGTRENNVGVIHIALQGNFNEKAPTDRQYEVLRQVVDNLKQRYPGIEINGHGENDGEHTSCPGKLFDLSRIDAKPIELQPIVNTGVAITQKLVTTAGAAAGIETPTDSSYNILFGFTRYYSPERGQNKYFRGSYEQDVIMNCGANGIDTNGCLYPASGIKYSMANKNKSVACPPKYKIGQKIGLWIKGKEHIVTCEDRGSAIQNNRLDMYCGLGTYAIENWHTCITGPIYGKEL